MLKMRKGTLGPALLLLLSTSNPAIAALELSPYAAQYQIDWDADISFSGNAVRQLRRDADHWILETKASALFASIVERSRFESTPHIKPSNYHFKRKALGRTRRADLSFDWQNGEVTNNVNQKPWKMAVPAGALDKLSVQLQLRMDLAAGEQQSFDYQVADGGHLKTYRFAIDGHEPVATPIGTFDTVRVKRVRDADSSRQTWIWFAPELDYLIVKLRQTEDDDKEYRLELKSLERN
ncbi:DUF3108 domain-containing protein [Marinobacterium arenosum]|uniref:DUF3108 domain-containing protein n=1 Tax=Marinobacterium arenosum TaxID=2862496 RepID=UPI001C97ED55|nr:DUF3108 domain-containing protein [Marinobacterium arenosum]MBY4677902.1 DUF3108 domain-containing protein [Marinobacterium arenosum]